MLQPGSEELWDNFGNRLRCITVCFCHSLCMFVSCVCVCVNFFRALQERKERGGSMELLALK